MRYKLQTGGSLDDVLFCDLVEEWWERIKAPTLAPGTVRTWRSVIYNHIIGNVDRRKLCAAVRRADLQHILDVAAETCKAGRVRQIKCNLSEICLYAQEQGLMRANYAYYCTIPANASREKPDRKVLTREQAERLMQCVQGTEIQVPVACMYYLGLRIGEAFGLTWGDVDLQKMEVHVHRSVDPATGREGDTKTTSGVRTVPVPDALVPLLGQRGLPGAPLFRFMPASTFYRRWVSVLLDAGLASRREGCGDAMLLVNYDLLISPHCLRHMYVTNLYDAGVDALSASRIVGHSSYQTTADIYTHISKSREQQNAVKINDIFNGCPKVAKEK